MNPTEKDNIISLLCSSVIKNIELAIALCEGYNVNIEDIIEEYGYNSIGIFRPFGFLNDTFECWNIDDWKGQFPANSQKINVYGYEGTPLNLHYNIKSLTFESSKITKFPDLSYTEYLYIRHSIVDFKDEPNDHVEKLRIQNCKIENIENISKAFPNLEDLVISNCNLKEMIDVSAFTELRCLSLRDNKITIIDKNHKIPNKLSVLDLSNNKIKSFDMDLNRLFELDLSKNRLTEFNYPLEISKLYLLDLRDNPELGEIEVPSWWNADTIKR